MRADNEQYLGLNNPEGDLPPPTAHIKIDIAHYAMYLAKRINDLEWMGDLSLAWVYEQDLFLFLKQQPNQSEILAPHNP